MRRIGIVTSGLLLLCLPVTLNAQQRATTRDAHERVWAVVPLVGAGTFEDPKRPLFVPTPQEQRADAQRLSYSFEISDDGKSAIVELWAPDRKAFAEILNSRRPDVKAFERGKATKEEIETEFRKHKKDFDANKLAERVR